MNNPKCAVCGHVNRVGAAVCEMCDTRLGEPAGAGAADSFRAAEESSDSYSGAYTGASAEGFGATSEGFDPGGGEPRAGEPPVNIPSPPFKGAGDVISPTLEVYRKHFLLVGALVLVTTLPVALLQYGVIQASLASAEEAIAAESGVFAFASGVALLIGLFSFAGSALLSGSLVYAVIDIQRTGAASTGESLRRGLRVLPKVFIVSLLYTIVTTIGFLLLIVPGVIFSLMYAVAVPAAVAERLGPFESLKRSARLTDGYKGLIFITQFLWGLIIVVINLVVSGSFAFGGAGEGGLAPLFIQSLVGGMLNASANVLTVYIYLGLLREHGEGFAPRVYAR
ncbi:MAG TPA: YciC family protein [Pyrinomonadaceae bacterium]